MRILCIIGFLLFSTSLAQGQEKKNVLATASMISDMVKQIAGDKVNIDCIVPIGGDPHLYDPVPEDARKAARADLILKNGLTFEGWLSELIDNSGTKATQILVTDGVESIESLTYENSADPHAWMTASNGVIYATNIFNALITLDPENKSFYTTNFNIYSSKLKALDQYIQEQINSIPENNRVLITSHDAFQYYGRRYGIQLEAILGTSTDAEEQTADIIRVNKVIRERNVPALFIESTVNPKLLKQIASDNDVRIGGSLYADSIGDKDSDAPTYYDMLKYNTDVIVKALTSPQEEPEAEKEGKIKVWWLGIAFALGLVLLYFIGKNVSI